MGHLIDANHLHVTKTRWKTTDDPFVVNHHRPHLYPPNQLRMQIRIGKSSLCPGPNGLMPLCQQSTAQLELLSIRRVGGQPPLQVFAVVGFKLSLDDRSRCVVQGIHHDAFCSVFNS